MHIHSTWRSLTDLLNAPSLLTIVSFTSADWVCRGRRARAWKEKMLLCLQQWHTMSVVLCVYCNVPLLRGFIRFLFTWMLWYLGQNWMMILWAVLCEKRLLGVFWSQSRVSVKICSGDSLSLSFTLDYLCRPFLFCEGYRGHKVVVVTTVIQQSTMAPGMLECDGGERKDGTGAVGVL